MPPSRASNSQLLGKEITSLGWWLQIWFSVYGILLNLLKFASGKAAGESHLCKNWAACGSRGGNRCHSFPRSCMTQVAQNEHFITSYRNVKELAGFLTSWARGIGFSSQSRFIVIFHGRPCVFLPETINNWIQYVLKSQKSTKLFLTLFKNRLIIHLWFI